MSRIRSAMKDWRDENVDAENEKQVQETAAPDMLNP